MSKFVIRLAAFAVLFLAASMSQAAAPACDRDRIVGAAPEGMTIHDIPNLGVTGLPTTDGGVVPVPADALHDQAPSFCLVTGSVATRPGAVANFAAELPLDGGWNGKFLFQGCGGNCGVALLRSAPEALRRGYPVFATDDGHASTPSFASLLSGSWAGTRPGAIDEGRVDDFYFRAVHAVAAAGKSFTERYYGGAPHHAYFTGCSDGGREGMVEIDRYPDDFDGVIAGDPYFDIAAETISSLAAIQVQLRTADAAISPAQYRLVDRLVMQACDAADGVADNLIQNPAACTFDPVRDLPRCEAGKSGDDCFTDHQVASLAAMLAAVTDPHGRPVFPGYPVSDLAAGDGMVDNLALWAGIRKTPDQLSGPEPWPADPAARPLAWSFASDTLRYLAYRDHPGFDALRTPGLTLADDAKLGIHMVVPNATLALLRRRTGAGNGNDASKAQPYLAKGHKLILYHGFSDGDITPYRTIQFYRALAGKTGGYAALRRNAALFMVPGMAHCAAGPGPNLFGQDGSISATRDHDILSALENWVEQGTPPAFLLATKYPEDDPARPPLRAMPLCPYPALARYSGAGDPNEAGRWSCPADDRGLLADGAVGRRAGLDHP